MGLDKDSKLQAGDKILMVDQVAQSKVTVTTKAETNAAVSIDKFKPILPIRLVEQFYSPIMQQK